MVNVIVIEGNCVSDIELKQANNTSFCKFSIAHKRKYKNKNGEYETDFFDIVAYRNIAEFASRYFKKGNRMIVTGEIETHSWQDKNSGAKRTSVEIKANNIDFAGAKEQTTSDPITNTPSNSYIPSSYITQSSVFEASNSDSDLPF